MRIFVPIKVAPAIVSFKPEIIKPTSNEETIQRITDFFKASKGKLLILTGAGGSFSFFFLFFLKKKKSLK